MHMQLCVLLLPVLAACGGSALSSKRPPPPPPPPPQPPHPPLPSPPATTIKLAVFDTTPTIAYRACFDRGHISLERGSATRLFRLAYDAARDRSATDAIIANTAWRVGVSRDGDLTQPLTIDGLHRDEQPQLWARSDAPMFVATSGLARRELDDVIARLGDPGAHTVGPFNVHVEDAAFESIDLISDAADATVTRLPAEHYSARFARATQWSQQAPWSTFAGVRFWHAAYEQPTTDHAGLPTIPAWHGEAEIDGLVLEIHATGRPITEARYLTFAEDVIRAALAASNPCRARSGHVGTP
ncbi:MAG: hypothetical protein AB7T06_45575 [Kofleriaceae bacterium]